MKIKTSYENTKKVWKYLKVMKISKRYENITPAGYGAKHQRESISS